MNNNNNNNKSQLFIADSVSSIKENGEWVLYNWLNGQYVIINDNEHFLFKAMEKEELEIHMNETMSVDDLNYLLEAGILVKSNDTVLEEIIRQNNKDNSADSLSLILLPAGTACNFKCKYCYEDHSDSSRMNYRHIEIIMNMIKSKNLKKLHIEYFGGEPLLNKQFIFELNSEIKKYASKTGLLFSSSMTTNGYLLTPEVFGILLGLNLNQYQITVDGLKEDHNYLRPLKNSSGSYDRIINNLSKITRMDVSIPFSINIRVNYNDTSASIEKRSKFLQYVTDLFKNDNRFHILFRPIADYSLLNNKQNNRDSYCSRMNSNDIQKLYENEAQESGLVLADLALYSHSGSHSCYAGKQNCIVLSPDLKVKKCTVALDDPINEVGYITLDGRLIKNDNWNKWTDNNPADSDKCNKCSILSICYGAACKLNNIRRQDRICPDIKGNIFHKIQLIIKQMESEA